MLLQFLVFLHSADFGDDVQFTWGNDPFSVTMKTYEAGVWVSNIEDSDICQ
jgi:hypothetical protein